MRLSSRPSIIWLLASLWSSTTSFYLNTTVRTPPPPTAFPDDIMAMAISKHDDMTATTYLMAGVVYRMTNAPYPIDFYHLETYTIVQSPAGVTSHTIAYITMSCHTGDML